MAACQAGDVSIVRELLEAGLDPNGVDNVSEGFRKFIDTVKPVLSGHSKRTPKIGFQDISLSAGQNYCRMLQGEHSAILSTFIKLLFVIKIFVLSIFEWPLIIRQVLLYV